MIRLTASVGGVAIITAAAIRLIPDNPTAVGFAYLLFVLILASTWGFVEASVSSVLSTLAFNFFFFPPVGAFTIYDPQNWVALFSFLATSLIASRLSGKARRQAREAIERQQDVERLYSFSRAILLMDESKPFPRQLAQRLSEVFALDAVVLYDRLEDTVYRAGPSELEGLYDQLREAALNGTTFTDPPKCRVITAVRLGSEPIAALALQGVSMPDSVLQGIANLVAIGLERARAQELAHQVEAANRSEQLRTTLIDAMAHELKTPLTSIKAATTALLAELDQPSESRTELLRIAGEEAEHLQQLIDDAIDMARLDKAQITIQPQTGDLARAVRDVIASLRDKVEDRIIEVVCPPGFPSVAFDPDLLKLAVKQVLDNALKYSPPDTAVTIRLEENGGLITLDITDLGKGIPVQEQNRIFERYYRSPSAHHLVPGTGLGLSIAHRIVKAHNGDLTVLSRPGSTTFRITLPLVSIGAGK